MTAKWVGAEDLEYVQMGGAALTTTAGAFRSSMGSRCGLQGEGTSKFWESIMPYLETDFWFSARLNTIGGSSTNVASAKLLSFLDEDLIERIRIVGLGSYNWKVEKVDDTGTPTVLGNSFFYPISITSNVLDKLDVYINNDVAGSIDVYVNGIHVFAFIGDTTTDSVTELCRHRLGGTGFGFIAWSETWIDDEDTRAQSLASFSPVANGNANTFDIGSPAAGNINEITLDVSTLNGSSVAAQIDQYTNGAVPTGTLDVKDVIISAYAQRGSSGPTKVSLGVRTNGANFWGTDQVLDIAWANIQQVFPENPDTTNEWLRTEIGAASGFNIGSKSAA